MNPNYMHDITVFRHRDGVWSKTVLRDCFWRAGISVSQTGTQAAQSNTYTVRIPLEASGENFEISAGDIVVHGDCPEEITGKSPNTATEVLLRCKPMAFKVTAVSDNTKGLRSKHYRLGG